MALNLKYDTVLATPSTEALELPFYPILPKDEASLLKLRIHILKRSLVDATFRDKIDDMCRRDVVFFATIFCWIHETRDDAFTKAAGKFPFLPWTDQVDLFAWLQKHAGKIDMTIEKTRGIGLSWIIMIFLLWKWKYHGEHLDYAVLSKDDKSLDLKDRPATLMGKLDLLFAHLPSWMQLGPDGKTVLNRTSTNHKFEHKLNNNAIIGFTATDDKLRSARTNMIVVDEAAFLPVDIQRWLAASQFVSSSRIFVSTHDGTASMFYRMTINEKARLVRISTWWQANPARAAGMYIVKHGQVQVLDTTYKFPIDYPFCMDHQGLPRSPWVDGEFEKPEADQDKLMQEIYGTAAIDTKKLLQSDVLDIALSTCCPPIRICKLNEYDEFQEDYDGEWRFWTDELVPFTGMYYVGVDPALGVIGAALAGITVIDAKTGEVVVTAGLKNCTPVELAKKVTTLCKLLCGPRGAGYATVVYESTGIGVSFLTEMRRLRWPSIWMDGKKYGMANRDGGEKVLIEAGRAIKEGELIIRDRNIVDDLDHFEYNSREELVFTGVIGHGDIGQALALAWWGARTKRRAVLDIENPPKRETETLIEQESLFRRPKRKNWSDRFALTPRY